MSPARPIHNETYRPPLRRRSTQGENLELSRSTPRTMPKAYWDDDQPKKNVFRSLDSTKKQKTLGFVIRRRDTTTSDATSSNASSSNAATSMRSTGTSSSSTSTIFTVEGKENNIRLCSDEENTSASSGGRGNATSSKAESDDSGPINLCDTDEEDDQEPAAVLLPSKSHRTSTAGGQGNDHQKPAAKRTLPSKLPLLPLYSH